VHKVTEKEGVGFARLWLPLEREEREEGGGRREGKAKAKATKRECHSRTSVRQKEQTQLVHLVFVLAVRLGCPQSA
jgi:hypothetical protein